MLVIIIIKLFLILNCVFKGVFARADIQVKKFICWVPLMFFENARPMDKQRHFIWQFKGKVFADSTGYKNVIIGTDGFGHMVNTCHPRSVEDFYKESNAKFVQGPDKRVHVVASKLIKAGEEILCDYHSTLAVESPCDSFLTKAIGRSCKCPDCEAARREQDEEADNLKKRKRGKNAATSWPDASSEVYQHLIAKYFEAASSSKFTKTIALTGLSSADRVFNILEEDPSFSYAGAGLTEPSWRNLLMILLLALPKDQLQGGGSCKSELPVALRGCSQQSATLVFPSACRCFQRMMQLILRRLHFEALCWTPIFLQTLEY